MIEQVKWNIDCLSITETKVDDTFSIGNLLIDVCNTPYCSDRDSKGGDIMLFVSEDITSNLLAIENKPIDDVYEELVLRNDKWLINCSYNPHKNTISFHINKLNESKIYLAKLNLFSVDYDKVIIPRVFNIKVNDNHMIYTAQKMKFSIENLFS